MLRQCNFKNTIKAQYLKYKTITEMQVRVPFKKCACQDTDIVEKFEFNKISYEKQLSKYLVLTSEASM